MTDYDDSFVKEMLDKQVPLRLDAKPDWAAVVRLAASNGLNEAEGVEGRQMRLTGGVKPRSSGRTPRSRRVAGWAAPWVRSRRFLVPVLGALVLAAGAAVAVAGGVPWWDGSGPPRPLSALDTSSAEKLVEFRLTSSYSVWSEGDTIAIWRLPQQGGVECYFGALASSKPTSFGGGSCGQGAMEVPSGETIRIEFSTTLVAGRYSWLISGQVASESGVAKLELDSANGRLPLSYANGWFLGQLPSSGSAEELPQGGPYVLVGYDDNGTEVTRLDLGQARKRLRAH